MNDTNSTCWVYVKSEPSLWTTGYYANGKWFPDEDFNSVEEARERVHFLNGGKRE